MYEAGREEFRPPEPLPAGQIIKGTSGRGAPRHQNKREKLSDREQTDYTTLEVTRPLGSTVEPRALAKVRASMWMSLPK